MFSEVHLGCAHTILRQPDRKPRRKPKKRAGNARPYDIDFCSDNARGNGFIGSFDTGLPQSTYPQQRQFASKLPLSYISAVRATTGAVSHRRMRAPIAHTCMPTLRAISAS